MTVLRVTIRRPPRCRRCGGEGLEPGTKVLPRRLWSLCAQCEGRSAMVEYFFEYGPLTHTKAYWNFWEDEESDLYARQGI